MSRPGGFRLLSVSMSPLNGLKCGPTAEPGGEPDSTINNGLSMHAGNQLVPVVRRSEMSEQERQTYQQGPAYQDGEDSDEDDFHDAQENPDFDFFDSGSEHLRNTATPYEPGYRPFSFPQASVGHIDENPAFEQQSQQTNGLGDVMDLTDDGGEYAKSNYDQVHDDFDQYALPDEDFHDLGFEISQYRGEEEEEQEEQQQRQQQQQQQQQQPAQDPENHVNFSFDGEPQQYPEDHIDGNSTSNAPPEDDLFASTWGNTQDEDEDADSDIEIFDSATFTATLKPNQHRIPTPPLPIFNSATFTATLKPTQHRIPTPPLPTGAAPQDLPRPSPPRKKRDHPIKDVYGQPWNGRTKPGPDVDRDLSKNLKAHFRFHSRVYDLVPRVPHWEDLDWNRRYWIAVLLEGKEPRNAHSERDFVWMKGNRYSTVRTVMEKFVQTTVGDKTSVLMMGYERVNPEDQMQELDYFGDRLCVFRVLGAEHREAGGRSLVEGVIPKIPEVIELDDD